MSKIKDAMKYYDIFLQKHTKREAVKMLNSKGYAQVRYDPTANLVSCIGLQDPSEIFGDMKWREESVTGHQKELVW